MTSADATFQTPRLDRDRGQLAVALAAVAWSTAGVLQPQLSLGVATQVAGRALFASVAVAVYVAIVERGRVVEACRSVGGAGVGFAACLAVSSRAFIVALNHATVAQVLFIQAIAPVLAAWSGRRVPLSAEFSTAPARASSNARVSRWRSHASWLGSLTFNDPLVQLVFAEHLASHEVLLARRDRLDNLIAAQAVDGPWASLIARLRCLRGSTP